MIPSFKDTSDYQGERDKIIRYWNEALLCSPESSTSHADPDLAYLDNAIENHILAEFLQTWASQGHNCLDIGAGYGRFVNLFKGRYAHIVLLEPAEQIYTKLINLWKQDPRVECHNADFESYVDDRGFDLVFASGVLYLYSDKMLLSFARKAISMVNPNGIFLLRDFISLPDEQVLASGYVKDGFCYYRTPQFWRELTAGLGIELLEIKRSKPTLAWLRNKRMLSLLRMLRLKRMCRWQTTINAAMRWGRFQMSHGNIHTVFIGMKCL